MQDRYSGDVGDFGKFSLLKSLLPRPMFKLGVIWYLYPDESHNNDGRHIEYLDKREYSICDDDLRTKLKQITGSKRSVSNLELHNILASNTTYYSDLLDFHIKYPLQTKLDKELRLSERQLWLTKAINTTSDCNAVFLDPDNGLEIKSCEKMSKMKSGKYAYYNEIRALNESKDVCVIYHHMNMNLPHKDQIQERIVALRKEINPSGKIMAARFTPHSPRAYFIITSKEKESIIESNMNEFLNSPCGIHWDNYTKG